jgi:hypothetical protein
MSIGPSPARADTTFFDHVMAEALEVCNDARLRFHRNR